MALYAASTGPVCACEACVVGLDLHARVCMRLYLHE